MLQHQNGRVEREGARKKNARAQQRRGVGDTGFEAGGVDADFGGQGRDTRHDLRRHGLEREIERDSQVLRDGHAFQQHDAIADDAEALDEREPLVAVGDGARRAPKTRDFAGLWQGRSGNQVDKHFSGGTIEADEHGDAPSGHAQIAHAKRPQSAVRLLYVSQLERVGHYCSS